MLIIINSILILDRASFYLFIVHSENEKKCITVFTGFPPNFGSLKMNEFPNLAAQNFFKMSITGA